MMTVFATEAPRPREPRTTSLTLRRFAVALTVLAAGAAWSHPAEAHVKWFAPYIVGAAPQPIGATLSNLWFWTGIGLVLAFFLATLAVERGVWGKALLAGLDRVTAPLWNRADDFMRATTGAFFVAIFAAGST
jgi:hypothetical protein